ncbi:MAG: glycosyltransferase family 4 protein [Fibromonadaceae bacterium]|nr:glycosyltransferase family 4 protein [Fibromonadaceae bacterium]
MPKNLSVLVITSVYPRFDGDQEVPWLRASLLHLKNAGFKPVVVAPSHRACPSKNIDGIKVRRFRYAPAKYEILTHDEGAPSKMAKNPLLQLLAIPYIISGSILTLRLCFKFKPGIIHAHWPFPHGFMVFFAKIFYRVPVVLNFHGAEILLMRKKKWIKPFLKFFIKHANLIFANSSFTAKKIKEVYNKNVEISPYGTTFESSHALLPSSRHKFAILFVGRHIERKGIEYLIKAAASLDSEKFQVRIAGAGDLTEKLKEQAEREAPKQIVFLGKMPKEDLAREYQNASCFVLPAVVDSKGDTEGLGVVLIEAAEYGLPLIASDVGGIGDVVIHKKTGLLVPEKNPDALAGAIKELSENAGLQKALVLGASEHIKQNFSWDAIIKKQLELYGGILEHIYSAT